MELQTAMEQRRSIRAYQPGRELEPALLVELIRAAQLAPSWKNSQTGRYYVLQSPQLVQRVKQSCLPPFNARNCADAPVLIVTAFETKRSGFDREGKPENELGDHWGAYDLGLQNQNLMLKATELGLATLVMGIRDGEALRSLLKLPESQELVSVLAVGYPAIAPDMPPRKQPEQVAVFL